MKPYYLTLFLYFAENAYSALMSNESQINTANWTHVTVRKPLNTSIIAVTFETVSLMGCASACTWSAREVMAPSFNFEQDHGRCHCNNALDDTEEDKDEPEVTYGFLLSEMQNISCINKTHNPDCDAYFLDGCTEEGLYKIRPSRDSPIKDVSCYFDRGGWTEVQFRNTGGTDVTVDGPTFNRSWTDYVNGFDSSWIGLETLHQITKRGSQVHIIILTEMYAYNAFYSNFTVGNAASNYTLYVSGFVGGGGDSLSSHNGMSFSVPNGDNQCADTCAGGWWFKNDGDCGQAILNLMTYGNSDQCPLWETGIQMNSRFEYSSMYVSRLGTPHFIRS